MKLFCILIVAVVSLPKAGNCSSYYITMNMSLSESYNVQDSGMHHVENKTDSDLARHGAPDVSK
jgi:hypothetical protein